MDGGLYVKGNDNLTSLVGLDSLGGADIYITENPALADLRGLENLVRPRLLSVENNAAFTSLAVLGDLERISILSVVGNPALDWCHIRDVAMSIGLENIDEIDIKCNLAPRICSDEDGR
jgi:hypothetical protein